MDQAIEWPIDARSPHSRNQHSRHDGRVQRHPAREVCGCGNDQQPDEFRADGRARRPLSHRGWRHDESHAAGSGRALEMLNDGIVDVAISHAPEAESQFLQRHPEWSYRKLAYNRFLVVGPPADVARVREATDIVDAFRRIARSNAEFVSRGDGSGTHERELRLWERAGTTMPSGKLLVSGRGMGLALRHAHERNAYTLSDGATYWQLSKVIDLVPLLESDEALLNTYAVLWNTDNHVGSALTQWLTRDGGRDVTAAHAVAGRQAFAVWPVRCGDRLPEDIPCGRPPVR